MMDSVHHVSVPLRAGKKMKKRKELDALVAHSAVAGKRSSGSGGGGKRSGGSGGGASSQDGLLSESTDDQEDYWVLGGKGRGSRGQLMRRRVCGSVIRACTVALVFGCVVATTTVMWLFIDIREQVTSLRIELDQVAAGSQGVPDALQKCHSVSRELQQNQTALYARLAQLTLQIGNFSTQLTGLQTGLHDVEERLKAAPELVNVPQHINELTANVAKFGSQINDFGATVATLKLQNGQLQDANAALVVNVTALQTSMAQVADLSSRPVVASQQSADENADIRGKLAQITLDISHVNDTLLSKLNWLGEDQHKDHALIEAQQNVGQNVTARVTTLEGSCAKQSAQAALTETVKKLADNMSASDSKLTELTTKLSQLQAQADTLEQRARTDVLRTNPSVAEDVPPFASTLLPPATPAPTSQPPPAPPADVKPAPAPKPPVTRP